MAILGTTCPHCTTTSIALEIRDAYAPRDDDDLWAVFLKCPKCQQPSCAVLLDHGGGSFDTDDLQQSGDPQTEGWKIESMWPAQAKPNIPEALPDNIARIYLQAERNFPIEGNEEAAGTMYRKALDVGLKKIDPDTKGTLAVRIKKLAAANKLTPDIAEWADHVRDLGNDAAHEDEPPTRDQLKDLRNFTEMVMRYLFSLPALVQARKPKISPPA
jgi:hypothetical protein